MSVVFDYRTTALVTGLMLGMHKSRQRGTGSDFYKKSLFLDEPDTSRLDLNASLTDPFEALHVKTFRQRSKLDVQVLVDGSSSMLFADKPGHITRLFDSIQQSVEAASDQFYGYLMTQSLTAIDNAGTLQQALTEIEPEQNRAEAYIKLHQVSLSRPSIVFIISDFHWPETQLESMMTVLSSHLVVPVVLWSNAEKNDYPLWRFVEITDLETGKASLVFVTKAQRDQIQHRYQQQEHHLNQQFRRFNQRPFWLKDRYDPRDMSRYFAMQ